MAPEAMRGLTRAILRDIDALEQMLGSGLFETGVRRIGAEQEMFLVDRNWLPAPLALKVMEEAADPRLTPELALFNLEINLDPIEVGRDMLADFQVMLEQAVHSTDDAARRHGGRVVLSGILPTLTVTDLALENMTPRDRYYALNDAVMKLAGGKIRLRMQGTDELGVAHDNVMLEACNTSFQVHFQVGPEEFATAYNIAQAVAGPVLAACVNSPMLFGKRLWKETRIALFIQAVDAHPDKNYPRDRLRRVWFGGGWVNESVAELFRENVLRFRPLVAASIEEDALDVLEKGGVPSLPALLLHNGTVYRWNRPCYGIFNGKPHLRIECRYIPSGPSMVDEVANAAFWIGLMHGGLDELAGVRERMSFDDARSNFFAAARLGLDAGFTWIGGERVAAKDLLQGRLLPLARTGLLALGVCEADVNRYLGIVGQRIATGATGAHWLLRSDLALRDRCPRTQRMIALTDAMTARARDGTPVHEWESTVPEEAVRTGNPYDRVEYCMTTDLFTVSEDDAVDIAAFIMNERGVRQILVEDDEERLVGVISYRSLLHMLAAGRLASVEQALPVSEVMERKFLTIEPGTPTLEAVRMMLEHNVTALPVLNHGKLVGIISEHDLLPVFASVLEQHRNESGAAGTRPDVAGRATAPGGGDR